MEQDQPSDFLTVVAELGATAQVGPVWDRIAEIAPLVPPPVTTDGPEGWNLFWRSGGSTLELKLLPDGQAVWLFSRDDGGGTAGSMASPAHLLSSDFVAALEELTRQASA